ncbi:MAG: metal-dependent hydrolase [Promethearchaeota archaeon]
MFPFCHIFTPLIFMEILHKIYQNKDHRKYSPLNYRRFWLMLGAILPDLLDKPLSMLFPSIFSGRGIAHSPFILIIIMTILFLTLKQKFIPISLSIGSFFHLILDSGGMVPWFWPFVNYPICHSDFDQYFYTILHNPLIQITETIGFLGLVAFAIYFGLIFKKKFINWENVNIFLFNKLEKSYAISKKKVVQIHPSITK